MQKSQVSQIGLGTICLFPTQASGCRQPRRTWTTSPLLTTEVSEITVSYKIVYDYNWSKNMGLFLTCIKMNEDCACFRSPPKSEESVDNISAYQCRPCCGQLSSKIISHATKQTEESAAPTSLWAIFCYWSVSSRLGKRYIFFDLHPNLPNSLSGGGWLGLDRVLGLDLCSTAVWFCPLNLLPKAVANAFHR